MKIKAIEAFETTDKKAVVSNNTGTGQRSDLGARLVYLTPLTVGLNLSYFFK